MTAVSSILASECKRQGGRRRSLWAVASLCIYRSAAIKAVAWIRRGKGKGAGKAALASLGLALCLTLAAPPTAAAQDEWPNLCPDERVAFCQQVGKTAYEGDPAAGSPPLGRIEGVVWRPAGTLIGLEYPYFSENNEYYYLIKNDAGKSFLRLCQQVKAR